MSGLSKRDALSLEISRVAARIQRDKQAGRRVGQLERHLCELVSARMALRYKPRKQKVA